MTTPLEDIANAIRAAIDGAIQDNAAFFEGLGTGGTQPAPDQAFGSGGDIVGLVVGLAALGLLAGPEIDAVIAMLKGMESTGGKEGISFSVGYFLASTLLQFAEPYTRYVTHAIENAAQSQIFEPDMAADLAARGIITKDFGASEAAGGGFDGGHFTSMVEAAYERPTWDVGLSMWNRGYITENDVNTILRYQRVPDYWWPFIKEMRQQLLSPADWALATLRGNVTEAEGEAGAALTGMSKENFTTLIGNTGEPPGLMQMLEAYRRDFIDEATLEKGIRESRVRNEWISTVVKLRYSPMSVAEAARAVVQNYLTPAQGAAIAQQNGLEPDHWQYVYESWGRPLAHGQMMQLYYRGLATRDQVNQAFRESDLKDKYINESFELGVKLLPLFEGVNLAKNGDITPATLATQLLQQGYQKGVVDEITKALGGTKAATAKRLTLGEIVSMYDNGTITKDTAQTHLEAIGYSKDDSESILILADAKAANAIKVRQITRVEDQYNRHTLTLDAAREELQDIGVDKSQITKLLNAWEAVRPPATRQPTESQIFRLVKLGKLTAAEGVTRLESMGFDSDTATMLIDAFG